LKTTDEYGQIIDLQYLYVSKKLNRRQADGALYLSRFGVEMNISQGHNGEAIALSRRQIIKRGGN